MARIYAYWLIIILAIPSCSGRKVNLSPQEVSSQIHLLVFFQEKDKNLRNVALEFLQNNFLTSSEKILPLKPLGSRMYLFQEALGIDFLLLFTAGLEENENLLRQINNSPFGRAFQTVLSIFISPVGFGQNFWDMPYILIALEKRYPNFNKMSFSAKEKIIQREDELLLQEIAGLAVGSYLCFTNSSCDTLRFAGFTSEASYLSFSLSGVYLKTLRKSPTVQLFPVKVLPVKELTRAY